ncbi:MAG: efflux RND transporter periplasmic adaptor subunit [Anaerolineae bacterium]|nr:efflux RND transporter periplasmic adaptor subunit [Anaerolineae bacterium]
MKRWIVAIAALSLVGGAAAGVWWIKANRPQTWAIILSEAKNLAARLGLATQTKPGELIASGFIEADKASVATELGGRIVAIHAGEGDNVSKGQVVVELDSAILKAQIEQAQADVAVTEAVLAQVKASVRPETLDYAQALVEQAKAGEEAGRVAWEDAKAVRDNPQQLDLSIAAAQAQLGVLSYQGLQAQAMANSAQAGQDLADMAVQVLEDFEPYDQWVLIGTFTLEDLPVDIPLPPGMEDGEYQWKRYKLVVHGGAAELWYLAPIRLPGNALPDAYYEQAAATYQSWLAWTELARAQAGQQGAASYLAALSAQRANPLTLQAQADNAESQYRIASTAVVVAQAQVDGMKMGATPQQIAAAEAQVAMARAALEALKVQLTKLTLKAPLTGLVLERPVHVGEIALPGAPLLTVANLDNLTLTLYVPESELGKIRLGEIVSVTVDAYPGRLFTGTITTIAGEAEFTPKNVQTREERVSMVFAVKVRLTNRDHALKPGMPADAVISTQ